MLNQLMNASKISLSLIKATLMTLKSTTMRSKTYSKRLMLKYKEFHVSILKKKKYRKCRLITSEEKPWLLMHLPLSL